MLFKNRTDSYSLNAVNFQEHSNMSLKIFCFVYFAILQYYIQALTISQQKIIRSISDELISKQIILVKNLSKETRIDQLVEMLKYFSTFQIYTSFQSVNEMNSTFQRLVLDENNLGEYYPRTMAIIDNNDLGEMLELYFDEYNELAVPKIIWIAFKPFNNDLLDRFYWAQIPYNCQFLTVEPIVNGSCAISEIYNTYRHADNYSVTHFGTWNKTNGLSVSVHNFYNRRIDLFGALLAIRSEMNKEAGSCNYADTCALDSIVVEMSVLLNFSYDYVYDLESYEKIFNKTPTLIEFKMDDGGVYVYDSVHYNSFLVVVGKSRAFFHIRYHEKYEKGISSAFIRPFSRNMWYSIGIWILITTSAFLFMNYVLYPNKGSVWRFNCTDIFFISFESFTNQCGNTFSVKRHPLRIASFLSRIPPLFLVSAYSGIIISFLTIRIIKLPFNDIEGLINDGTFKVGYENDTFVKFWFEETNNPLAKIIYRQFIDKNDMPEYQEGINKMCDNSKFTYIRFDNELFQKREKCKILQIPTSLFQTNDALALREKSPYKKIFYRMISQFRSTGFLGTARKKIYYENEKGLREEYKEKYVPAKNYYVKTVDLDSVISIFILLIIMHFISIIIFLLECFMFRKSSKNNNPFILVRERETVK